LPGLLKKTARVFSASASRNASCRSTKPSSACVGTTTSFAPASRTMSTYEGQYGAGTIASSPGFNTATQKLNSACLAPVVAMTSRALNSRPLSRCSFLMIAAFRAGVPATELHRTGGRYALVTMCIGGGQGIAAVFERL